MHCKLYSVTCTVCIHDVWYYNVFKRNFISVGKYSYDAFCIQNEMKQRDSLALLLLSSALKHSVILR